MRGMLSFLPFLDNDGNAEDGSKEEDEISTLAWLSNLWVICLTEFFFDSLVQAGLLFKI